MLRTVFIQICHHHRIYYLSGSSFVPVRCVQFTFCVDLSQMENGLLVDQYLGKKLSTINVQHVKERKLCRTTIWYY